MDRLKWKSIEAIWRNRDNGKGNYIVKKELGEKRKRRNDGEERSEGRGRGGSTGGAKAAVAAA